MIILEDFKSTRTLKVFDGLEDSFNKIHNGKYNYSKSIYSGVHNLIVIVCPKHGDFKMTPGNHKSNKQGCPKCGTEKMKKIKSDSKESFIEKANLIHGKRYDYSNVLYINSKKYVDIICSIHGKFRQFPSNHLKGQGCPYCGKIKLYKVLTKPFADFVKEANKIHNSYYIYDEDSYKNAKGYVNIICTKHGKFRQRVQSHLSGNGCSSCAIYGFNTGKNAILYYLKVTFNNTILYKIGITNRTVKERFSKEDLENIEILAEIEYKNGIDALNKEKEIKEKFKDFKYKGEDVLSSGNTELFTKDILNYDKQMQERNINRTYEDNDYVFLVEFV